MMTLVYTCTASILYIYVHTIQTATAICIKCNAYGLARFTTKSVYHDLIRYISRH